MKNKILIATAALAALSLASCQRFAEGPVPAAGNSWTLTISCAGDDTKTDISGEKVVWSANDKVWLTDGNKSTIVTIPAAYNGCTTADIIVTGLSQDSTIYATYPANDNNDIYKDGVVVEVPTVQDGSFGSAHIAVGQKLPGQRELLFRNSTAILKFSHHQEDIRDIQIRNINLAFSGTYTIDPATGERDKKMVTDRTVRLTMSGTSDKYIAVMPGSMAKNSKFVFVTVDGKLGSIATSTSNTLERNKIYDLGNIDDKVTYYGPATDIGAIETANCYLVPGPGVYKFKAVKGNSIEPVSDVTYAELIWESLNTTTTPNIMSIISEVAYSDGYVYFRVPDNAKDGNALVALYDKNGEIAWSWHLWVLKDGITDISLDDGTGANSGAILMDRNLGAVTATKGKATSNGFLYQWGRKDPFTGCASLSANTLMVTKGIYTPAAIARTDDNGTIEYSIAQPYQFLYKDSKDWLIAPDATLWSASAKTVYDPCPPGYHVPFADALDGLKGKWDATNKGCSATVNGNEIWFPAGGNRKSGSGAINNGGSIGYYWYDINTSTASKGNVWKFSSTTFGLDTTSTNGLCCGFELRCQKTATVGDKQTLIVKFDTAEDNMYVYSPIISSSGYSDAKVFWSGDFSETLENGKWKQYIYKASGSYSLTVTGYSISNVSLKTLDGVKSIDISNF